MSPVKALYSFAILCCLWAPAYGQSLSAYRDGTVLTFFEKNEYWFALQDRQGFIWGYNKDAEIARFDGSEYHPFLPDPADDSAIQVVTSREYPPLMMEDSEGKVWIVYSRGVDRYDPLTSRFEHIQQKVWEVDSVGPWTYGALFEDSKRNFWIGGQRKLYVYTPAVDTVRPVSYSQHVWLLMEDDQGFVWHAMGTPVRTVTLVKTNPESLEKEATIDLPIPALGLASHEMSFQRYGSARIPGREDAFMVMVRGCLYYLNAATHELRRLSVGLEEGEHVYALLQEGETIVVGTSRNRVLEFNPETASFQEFAKLPAGGDAGEAVIHLFASGEGILWVVTTARTFQILPRNDLVRRVSLPDEIYQTQAPGRKDMMVSFQGECYFHTKRGLIPVLAKPGLAAIPLEFEDADFEVPLSGFKDPSKYPDNLREISGFIFRENAAKKTLWMLLYQYPYGMKLFEFDEKGRRLEGFHCRGRDTTCYGDHYMDMDIDRQGNLWLAGWAGLVQFEPERRYFRSFVYKKLRENTLNSFNTAAVRVVGDKEVWVGYFGRGASRYDLLSGTFTHYMYDPADPGSLMSDEIVLRIYSDAQDRVWIGTRGGLSRWNPDLGSFSRYGRESGLASRYIQWLGEDVEGRVWATTPDYINLYDPEKDVFLAFGKEDGLPALSSSHIGLSDLDGNMFFLTVDDDVAVIPAAALRPDTILPRLIFTAFFIENQRVKPSDSTGLLAQDISFTNEIELRFSQRNFAVQFAALDFLRPEKITCAYMLEGYDKEWKPVGAERKVSFTNLPPGRYVFRLTCYNRHGFESKAPIELRIAILPPWYRTWAAWMLWAALSACFAVWFYRFLLRRQLAIAEARRLKELDVTKSRLFANISHEFRTPLTVILGNAGLLEKSISKGGAEMLAHIKNSANVLLRLVNQLLDLARLEAGKIELRPASGDVVAFARYVLESFHSLAGQKNIALHFSTEPDSLVMDYDPERLQQVLSNLLSNAVKFTPEGGSVFLSLRGGQALEVSVRDTGVGIAPESLPHIFDRFYQADDASTRRGDGTGIGLALTKELVQLMRGTIAAASRPGEGSIFTLTLPIERKSLEQAPQVSLPAPFLPPVARAGKKKAAPPSAELPRILLVEDNAEVAAYIRRSLQPAYDVIAAANGREGVELALREPPDLVVSDVMMPEMDGYELCRILKEAPLTCHIPVVLLTARADIHSKLEGLERGADAYLAKPFHEEELRTRIRNLLENRRQLRAHYQSAEPPPQKAEDPLVKRCRELIERDLMAEWDAGSLAEAMSLSQLQLYRKLKSVTGLHITAFVRDLRLKNARRLLREKPHEPVASIGYEVGFSSPQEFARRFKEAYQCTPAQWRGG